MEEMKPYTLRLADDVDAVATIYPDMEEVSDELRRLHEVYVELLEALQLIAETDSIDAALDPQREIRVARAAISKAIGA